MPPTFSRLKSLGLGKGMGKASVQLLFIMKELSLQVFIRVRFNTSLTGVNMEDPSPNQGLFHWVILEVSNIWPRGQNQPMEPCHSALGVAPGSKQTQI